MSLQLHGCGTYTVDLTAGTTAGVDTYQVTVVENTAPEGTSSIILAPNSSYEYFTPGDTDGDGEVDIGDFLFLLGNWGPCPDPCPPYCPADFDADCEVGIEDFLVVLGNWTI